MFFFFTKHIIMIYITNFPHRANFYGILLYQTNNSLSPIPYPTEQGSLDAFPHSTHFTTSSPHRRHFSYVPAKKRKTIIEFWRWKGTNGRSELSGTTTLKLSSPGSP